MSVPKNKRNLSDFEFFKNALQLNKEITILFIDDFHIKDVSKKLNLEEITKDMSKEEAEEFIRLVEEYHQDNIEIAKSVPLWILREKRNLFLRLMEEMVNNIIMANSIYPTNMEEFNARRLYQDKAIGNCHALLTQFQIILYALNGYIKVDKYKKYIKLIDDEIRLLKGWRVKSNRFLKKLGA